jgi:FkbM family methyltransferase
LASETLDYKGAEIKVVANTHWERRFRIKPVFKEPETAAWIDEYVQKDDVFYDIGANVGGYGLIAASRGAEVFAFEPEAMNYGRLVQNIGLNPDLGITPLPFAIWDRHELLTMHMQESMPGAADHQITSDPALDGRPFRQAIFTVAIDDLPTWDIPQPAHMKIDVDGYESRVLAGATLTLGMETLRSVMVEIDHGREDGQSRDNIFEMMKTAGLSEADSWHRSPMLKNHLFVRPI